MFTTKTNLLDFLAYIAWQTCINGLSVDFVDDIDGQSFNEYFGALPNEENEEDANAPRYGRYMAVTVLAQSDHEDIVEDAITKYLRDNWDGVYKFGADGYQDPNDEPKRYFIYIFDI